jgi:EAL domain-containing protein (putative c-di-GMP-specific phosphodiesterase class I)
MPEIDRWVINKTFTMLKECPRFSESATLLINLSGQSLCDSAFVSYLEQELETDEFKASSICFEIAERAVISNLRSVCDAIKRLKKAGCRFALDDFGGSLNSMGNLKELGMDYVKLDGNCVRNMTKDQIDAAMVRAINEIAHAMGVATIAEMVESEEVLEAIRTLGVDYCQGHVIAVPQPIEQLFNQARKSEGLCVIS